MKEYQIIGREIRRRGWYNHPFRPLEWFVTGFAQHGFKPGRVVIAISGPSGAGRLSRRILFSELKTEWIIV